MISLLIISFIFLMSGKCSYAAAGRRVIGSVTNNAAQPIEGSSITINCLGNTLKTKTDSAGTYSAQFEKLSHCLKGSVVGVTAEKQGVTDTVTKKMEDASVTINLSLAYSPPLNVPEYGHLGASATAILAGAAYYILKQTDKKTI